jgi:hypothetical protein
LNSWATYKVDKNGDIMNIKENTVSIFDKNCEMYKSFDSHNFIIKGTVNNQTQFPKINIKKVK